MQEIGKQQKIVIGMVGLPARGKTYISRKINRYVNWLGYNSRVFNIGNYRRQICGTDCDQNFFDPQNEEAVKARDQCALMALSDLETFLKQGGDVAIYDGTNSTVKRRKMIQEKLEQLFSGIQIFWIESICEDEIVIQKNISLTKLNNPDYQDKSPEQATRDFIGRIDKYKQIYQHISNQENISYVKIINIGQNVKLIQQNGILYHQQKIIIHKINGYLQSRIISYLMNLHIYPRTIYLTRHGESQFNLEKKIGGDSELTKDGQLYIQQLSEFFQEEQQIQEEFSNGVLILTSTLQRTLQTSEKVSGALQTEYISLKQLDEINAGVCDGLTYKQIAEKFPKDHQDRLMNKLTYRYPRGESYQDLISRLEPVIFEIERSRNPVIVIGHQACLRCLYAFFHENEVREVPKIEFPLHSLVKLRPAAYTCVETRISFDVHKKERTQQEDFQIKKVKSFIQL